MVGDEVGDVDLSIGPLVPQAASGGAGVGVPLGLRLDSDVASDQDGLVQVGVCESNAGVGGPLDLHSSSLFICYSVQIGDVLQDVTCCCVCNDLVVRCCCGVAFNGTLLLCQLV